MTKFKPVFVEWEDATSLDNWVTLEEVKESKIKCESVGMIVHETDKFIALALSYACTGRTELHGQVTVIPRCSIIGIHELKE